MQTGDGGGSVSEEGEKREQQVPDGAEAELQPAGGGVEALEGPPQAPDQREGSLGQSVRASPARLDRVDSAHVAHSAAALCARVQPEVKLKLSGAETYSKMRLKLVPNYNYDSHSDASAQRDNMGE